MTTASIPHTTEIGMDITVAMHIATALKFAQPNATPEADRAARQLDQALDYIRGGYSFTLRGTLLECQSQTTPMQYRTEWNHCTCPGYTYNGYCFHGQLLSIAYVYQSVSVASAPRARMTKPEAERTPPPTAPAYTYEAGPQRQRMSDAEYDDLCRRLDDECF